MNNNNNNNNNHNSNLNCKYCNKLFTYRQNTWRHEKKCKIKYDEINKLRALVPMQDSFKILKNEIIELKHKIINNKIINNKTINNNNNITNNNITNQPLQRRHGPTGRNNLINNNNIINITNIGNESINDLTKNEIKNIINSNFSGLTTLMNNIYFNSRLPDNHKIYNSSINNKYINVIEDNQPLLRRHAPAMHVRKIVKKKKSIIYDIIFTPCVKMLESIQVINNKNIKQCKEILDFYYNLPLRNKLMKVYYDSPLCGRIRPPKVGYEINIMSYNKKDLILNTWNKLLNSKNITEEESKIIKESIEEFKNSNEEFESSSDDYNSDNNKSNDSNTNNIIPNIYIKKNNKSNIIKVNKNNIIKVNQDSSESDD